MSGATQPVRCIEEHPARNTVYLCGVPISLTALCNSFDPPLDTSYVSRVFGGYRSPSVRYLRMMAQGLGMTTDALLAALDRKKAEGNSTKKGVDTEAEAV